MATAKKRHDSEAEHLRGSGSSGLLPGGHRDMSDDEDEDDDSRDAHGHGHRSHSDKRLKKESPHGSSAAHHFLTTGLPS